MTRGGAPSLTMTSGMPDDLGGSFCSVRLTVMIALPVLPVLSWACTVNSIFGLVS